MSDFFIRLTRERISSTDRIRSVTKNFFLHFHAPKIHFYSLRPQFTFGLGVINASLFLLLLFSGILLMVYYEPSTTKAYSSILDINNVVIGGRYLRNIHRWAAHGLVFFAMLHLARTFFTASYTKNRKMTWNLGIGLLLVTVLSSFTGYLLPWDQLGFWAVTIASNIVGSTREVTDALNITAYFNPGLIIKNLLLGGSDVTQESLTRFYLLHVVFLPLIFVLFTALHFWRIRKQGGLNLPDNADRFLLPAAVRDDKSIKIHKSKTQILSWPTALWAELAVFLTALSIVTLFGFLINAPLKEMANTAIPENPAKAPWYFLGVQELVSYSAFGGGLLTPLLVITALFLIPYLDKNNNLSGIWFNGREGLKIVLHSITISFATIMIMMIIIIQWGWLRDWLPNSPHWLPILINPGILCIAIFCLFALFIHRLTGSSRRAVIALFSTLATGYLIFTVIGIWFRGRDWEFILWPFF